MTCKRCEELKQQREKALKAQDRSKAADYLVLLKRCRDQDHPKQLKQPDW